MAWLILVVVLLGLFLGWPEIQNAIEWRLHRREILRRQPPKPEVPEEDGW